MADVNNQQNRMEQDIQAIKVEYSHVNIGKGYESTLQRIEHLFQQVSKERIGFEMDGEFLQVLEGLLTYSLESSNLPSSDICITGTTNCYRLCRNLCALCTNNQNIIHDTGTFVDVTDKLLCAVVMQERRSELMLVLLRCVTQFLGNYVSGNPTNQQEVWSKFQGHFRQLLDSGDEKLADYTLTVIHLCLCNVEGTQLLTTPTTWEVFFSAVRLATDTDTHNGLLVLEDALKVPGFCEHVYSKVPVSSKILVVELLINQLKGLPEEQVGKGEDCEESRHMECPTLDNIQYIAADYIMQAHCILNVYTDSSSESQALCTVKMLECLCLATSHHKLYGMLQDNQQLIKVTVSLLQSIEDLGRQGNSVFSNVEKMSEQHHVKIDHPVFGLKRDLIRLLGNMAYRHRANQDLIRELDGISLILDQTSIDGKNPFITQWAVFAVHNLTEDNADNRLFIANLRLEGVANNARVLDEMGLEADREGDKVVIKKKRQS